MLDGDVDYTLNISPYQPDTEYNVVYVIDTSISIDEVELQTIQNAYTDLTNFYINEGIAENINFGVVSYDSSGRFYTDSSGDINLTADEAIAALQNLTIDTRIGTRYYDGLNRADQFLLNSPKNPFETTGIGYFITDGQTFATTPNILASLSSYVGADPAGLRYRSLGASQVQMKVEEDTSLDSEMGHVDESVDFLAIAGTGNLSAVSVDFI